MHSPVLERIFPHSAPTPALLPLGRASVELVDEVCSRIATQHARTEARLTDVMQRLDTEEERGRRLEERINQADNAASEAELWMERLVAALKTKIMRRESPVKMVGSGATDSGTDD